MLEYGCVLYSGAALSHINRLNSFQSHIENMFDFSDAMSSSWVLPVVFWMVRDEATYKLFVQHLRNHQLDHLIDYTLLTRLAISILLTYVIFKLWIAFAVVGRPQLCLCGTQFWLTFYCGVIVWGGQSWRTFRGLLWCNCILSLYAWINNKVSQMQKKKVLELMSYRVVSDALRITTNQSSNTIQYQITSHG